MYEGEHAGSCLRSDTKKQDFKQQMPVHKCASAHAYSRAFSVVQKAELGDNNREQSRKEGEHIVLCSLTGFLIPFKCIFLLSLGVRFTLSRK